MAAQAGTQKRCRGPVLKHWGDKMPGANGLGNILVLAWLRAGVHSAILRTSLYFLYQSVWPGPGYFRYPPRMGVEGLSLLSSATLEKTISACCRSRRTWNVPAWGQHSQFSNSACVQPTRELFFSARVLFSSVFKLCRSYEFALIQHVSISSNKGRKRSSWEEFLSAADAEKHFYELLLSFSSKLPFL